MSDFILANVITAEVIFSLISHWLYFCDFPTSRHFLFNRGSTTFLLSFCLFSPGCIGYVSVSVEWSGGKASGMGGQQNYSWRSWCLEACLNYRWAANQGKDLWCGCQKYDWSGGWDFIGQVRRYVKCIVWKMFSIHKYSVTHYLV